MLSIDHDNHNWYQTSLVRTGQEEDRHKLVCLRGVQLGDRSEHSFSNFAIPQIVALLFIIYTCHFITFISTADLDIVNT